MVKGSLRRINHKGKKQAEARVQGFPFVLEIIVRGRWIAPEDGI